MRTQLTQPEMRIGNPQGIRACYPLIVALVAIVVGCASSDAVGQTSTRVGADVSLNDGLPREAQGITVVQNLGEVIPTNLALIDSQGKAIKTGYVFNGELPTIVTLNYSDCPMLCSVQLNKLTQSLNQMELKIGEDFRLLTVSIDPQETSRRAAETKSKYLASLPNQPGASKDWIFATATQPNITKLANKLGFKYRYDAVNKQYNHPAMLAFVSPDGVITRYSLDIEFPPDQMKMALVEAGQGNVGSAVDQFILWCYTYDPNSNSYTPQAWKIMRLCGAGFVGLLIAALVPYWVGRKGEPDQSAAAAPGSNDNAETGHDDTASSTTNQRPEPNPPNH